VGHHNHLPAILCPFDAADQDLEDSLIVEIVLGLIDNDRYVVFVYQEIENQQ